MGGMWVLTVKFFEYFGNFENVHYKILEKGDLLQTQKHLVVVPKTLQWLSIVLDIKYIIFNIS